MCSPGTAPYMFAEMTICHEAHPCNVSSLQLCISGGDACPVWLQDSFSAVSALSCIRTGDRQRPAPLPPAFGQDR